MNLNNYKLILIDLDGTIINSVGIKTKCYEQLFKSLAITDEQYNEIMNYHYNNRALSRTTKFNLLNELTGKDYNHEWLSSRLSNLAVPLTKEAEIFDGFTNFLRKYKNKILYCLTANPQKDVEEILKYKRLYSKFNGVIGTLKEKHKSINKIIKKYNLYRNEVVYIGDRLNDLIESKKCGINFIGFGDEDFPTNIKVIHSWEELE